MTGVAGSGLAARRLAMALVASTAIAIGIPAPAAAQSSAPEPAGAQTPRHYSITLVTSDTGAHLLGPANHS